MGISHKNEGEMAQVNMAQVARVAEILKKMPDSGHGMNFYSFPGKDGKEIIASDMYPALNNPQAVNFFFFVCLHEFGFWYGDDQGYVEPLYGTINGKKTKGSDLLWKACKKALDKDETIFEPARLAEIKPAELVVIFSDDHGPIPFSDFEERFKMTRAYGRSLSSNSLWDSSESILESANFSQTPVRSFLRIMKFVTGFHVDKLEKRQMLLAMILVNRLERFLRTTAIEDGWAPIVDYHLMRVNLRLGNIVLTPQERYLLENRKWVSAEIEAKIRNATKKAVESATKLSGKPHDFVDHIYWKARRYCPEMEKPDCPKCVFDEVCEKRVELFQPVFRTTAY